MECHNLKNVETFGGENDPFVAFNFGSWSVKTRTIEEGGSNVEWNDLNITLGCDCTHALPLEVIDENKTLANVLIGSGSLDLSSLLEKPGTAISLSARLSKGQEVTGSITVKATYYPASAAMQPPTLQSPEKEASKSLSASPEPFVPLVPLEHSQANILKEYEEYKTKSESEVSLLKQEIETLRASASTLPVSYTILLYIHD